MTAVKGQARKGGADAPLTATARGRKSPTTKRCQKKKVVLFMFGRFVSCFGSFWFAVCSGCGSGLGSFLAFPFFRVSFPSFWVPVRRVRASRRWVRRWPPRSCGRPSARSGFCGSWVVVPASSWRAVCSSCFVWWACPAVVGRVSGSVFLFWAFVSPAPFSSSSPCGGDCGGFAAAPAAA